MDIIEVARKIGTYEISSEPFHDCCPVFMPKAPALYASAEELEEAEAELDVPALVSQGIRGTSLERFRYANGKVETVDGAGETSTAVTKQRTAIA
jgi:thiamine biosynthesis protein ThiI